MTLIVVKDTTVRESVRESVYQAVDLVLEYHQQTVELPRYRSLSFLRLNTRTPLRGLCTLLSLLLN